MHEEPVFVAERCVFARNSAASYGGAAYNKATGTMHFRNCLFYRNTGRGNWGSAVYNDGPGSMVNCTLFNNPVTPASQGEFCRNYAAFGVTNCVFGSVSWYTGGTAHRMNNVESASDPGFVSAGGDDYRLSAAAERLIDQGEDSVVREGEVDLDGKPRVSGDHIDIGSHEFAQDVFSAGFMVEGEASKPGDTVRLVPKIVGGKNPVNTWRVENLAGGEPIGGQTVGTDATAAFEVTLTAPGVYSFYQQVTDGENGADNALPRYLAVLAEGDVFVAKDGASVPPFDTPATATTNLYAAVTMAGDGATVHVGPGTFLVDQRTALSHAATLVGAGVDQTVITAEPESSHGLVLVEHPRAVLRNVMLTGVFGSRYSDGHGGCVRLTSGAIEDCAITGGVMRATCDGTMLALETASGQAKPRASRVRVVGCRGTGFGTVIMNFGAVADNLLLVDCEVTPALHYTEPYGGLIYIDQSGGYVTNCTFVGTQDKAVFNYSGLAGTVTKMSGCVFDCPVSVVKDKVATNFFSCCASLEPLPEFVADNGNVVVEGMGFVDKANGDYHLRAGSPCRGMAVVNPGIKLDFDRKRRAKNGVVDAGCYQFHGYGLMMFAR